VRYDVAILPAALKQLQALPKKDRQRIRDRIDSLAEDPRPPRVKALKGGEGYLRLRVGDYRVVYAVHDDQLLVVVIRVAHRREAYR
jgi:mRNA interferase RelE/StbE